MQLWVKAPNIVRIFIDASPLALQQKECHDISFNANNLKIDDTFCKFFPHGRFIKLLAYAISKARMNSKNLLNGIMLLFYNFRNFTYMQVFRKI